MKSSGTLRYIKNYKYVPDEIKEHQLEGVRGGEVGGCTRLLVAGVRWRRRTDGDQGVSKARTTLGDMWIWTGTYFAACLLFPIDHLTGGRSTGQNSYLFEPI
jgi:hypothetical protein